MLDPMRRLPWIIGGLVVVIALIIAAPYLYKAARGGDDAPAASVSTEGAEAAVGELDGTWVVVPGIPPNAAAAGYTVREVLRGEPVTVVGSTNKVSGDAVVADTTLVSAEFDVEVGSLATDIGQRDDQARSPMILDTVAHPIATLTLAQPVDVSAVPDDGTPATLQMDVDLTVKGITVRKPVEVTALRSGEQLIASGSVPMTWTEVGVQPPSLGFVTVEPTGSIDFLVSLAKE